MGGGMTSALGLGIILTLQDRVSAGLASIQQKLLTFKGVTQDMVQSFDAGARQMIGGFMSMTAGKRVIGMIDGMFGTAVSVSRSFEMAMARVRAVSGATGETFTALQNQALEMGRTTRFTAMDAAGAQESLIRAGLDAQKTMAALPHSLNMAAAEGLTLSESAGIMSTMLNIFKIKAEDAARVSNVLAEGSRSSAGNIRSFAESMKYAGPVARMMGLSIEETVAWLSALANAGLKGSQGGTGLSNVLMAIADSKKQKSMAEFGLTLADEDGNLVTPDQLKKMKDKMQKLGVRLVDEMGNSLTPAGVMMQLANRLKGMENTQKVAMLKEIFGKIGTKAAAAMIDAVDEGKYQSLFEKYISTTNAAKEMSDITSNTGVGAMQKLTSATEALRIALGKQLQDAYDWVILKMAAFKSGIAQFIRQFPTLTKIIAGFITGLLALIGTLLIVTGIMAVFAGSIKIWEAAKIAMGVFFTGLKASIVSSLSMIWSMSTPILAIIGLVYGLKKAWDANLWGIRDVFDAISVGFGLAANANAEGLAELDAATHDRLAKNGSLDAALTMGQVFYRLREMLTGITEGFKKAFTELKNILDGISGAFAPIVEGSKALLNFLGFDVSSNVDSWRSLGEQIGYCIGLLVISAIAWKIFSVGYFIIQNLITVVSGLWGLMVANPVGAVVIGIIALIALLYIYWDDFANWIKKLFADVGYVLEGLLQAWLAPFEIFMGLITLDWDRFCNGLKSLFEGVGKVITGTLQLISDLLQPIIDSITWVLDKLDIFHGSDIETQNLNPNVGEQNYEQYRNQLISRGYVLDDNDRVMQMPYDMAMDFDETRKREIEAQLAQLRIAPQAPEQLKAQAEKQTPQAPDYDEFKKQLLSAGYVLDNKDRVIQLPNFAMDGDNELKRTVEAKLDELRSVSQPPQVQEQMQAQQPEAPRIQEQVKAPEIQPENNAYQRYRDKLVEKGYLLDKNDHVLQFPVDYGMDFDYTARQNIEQELARLKSAVAQPPKQTEPQIPQAPQPQPEAQTTQQALQPPMNSLQGGQSAGTIIRHDQNAASMNGAANAQAAAQNPVNVNVNNEIQTKIETSSSDVRINEDVIGNIVHRHMESHQLRQGIDYNGMGISYGGAE